MKLGKLIPLMLITALILSFAGCKTYNDPVEPDSKGDFVDLVINSDFKFNTTKEVDIRLKVITSNVDEPSHKFLIYQGDPVDGGKLIASGVTTPYNEFETTVKIPSYVSSLFVSDQDANNHVQTVELDANGYINYEFSSNLKYSSGFKSVSTLYQDPGCGSCDETFETGNYNKLTINNNTTYCIEAGSSVIVSNKIDFKGGTLIVCGNLICSNITANHDGGDFVISAGGTLSYGASSIDHDLDNFINYGVANISGTTTFQYLNLENHGIMNISGNVNISTDDFTNVGEMNIAGSLNNNEEGLNTGTLTVSGHFNNNGGSEFTNECALIITGNFNQNSEFTNTDNSYVEVGQRTTLNGGSTTEMGVQSLISTEDFIVNQDLEGPDVLGAKVDVADETRINGSGNVTGYIDICDADGMESNTGTVGPNVTFDCSTFIPTTGCNPGSGAPSDPDTDGDGVPDDQDDYPNDPDRATNDYYPNEDDFTSLACEDLWTGYGDYDFNDLVVMTNYKIVKNAQNEVVEVFGKFHIAAVGATLNNGFGVEFDVPASAVQSVTGCEIDGSAVTLTSSGIEDGSGSNAVMIVYSAVNDYLGTSMVNTVVGGNTMEIDTIEVHMLFNSPQASIGVAPYNPFMFIDQIRGKEIHKIDNAPTALVNVEYFGEGQDDSDPAIGRYYVSETNLPWVIEIPETFVWPIESADILTGYLKFQQWAESSGTEYTDWYENNPGYRDNDYLYEQE